MAGGEGGRIDVFVFFFLKSKPETNAGCRPFGNPGNFPRDEEACGRRIDIYVST
jgi:hypothetical protein